MVEELPHPVDEFQTEVTPLHSEEKKRTVEEQLDLLLLYSLVLNNLQSLNIK